MRVIETVSAGLDPDDIVQRVAAVITATTATDVCLVYLFDGSSGRLRLRGAAPPFDMPPERGELAIGKGVAGWVAAHREPVVIVDDEHADPRGTCIPAPHDGGHDYASRASVPILSRRAHLVGVLDVRTVRRWEFTCSDVELLRFVADLVAGAIENARLHRRLAEREGALERFTERMVELQEAERRRLAGEIHDGISQRIVSLSFHLSAAADLARVDPGLAAEQIARARELACAALDETRSAIAGLRPPVLDDLGLAASLESLASSTPDLDVYVDAASCRLPEHVETAVYRIAQEALHNVVKHADARYAEIRLRTTADKVVLEVRDDGTGFDPATLPEMPGPGRYGLSGMRERAALLGGKLELESSRGRGTTVRLSIPLPPQIMTARSRSNSWEYLRRRGAAARPVRRLVRGRPAVVRTSAPGGAVRGEQRPAGGDHSGG